MKQLILICVCFVVIVTHLLISKYASNSWVKSYEQEWALADKSSTIPAKSQHVEKFLKLLEQGYADGDLADHNALLLKNDNNSFASNLEALRTLATRLKEIEGMNPSSFEYNTAIQQITAQEQGEASAMLDVFEGCYMLENWFLWWGWVQVVVLAPFFLGALFCLLWGLFSVGT